MQLRHNVEIVAQNSEGRKKLSKVLTKESKQDRRIKFVTNEL